MIGNSWDNILKEEYKKDYFKNLIAFIKNEYKTKTIYPKQTEVFNAFKYTDFNALSSNKMIWIASSLRSSQ